MEINVHAAKTMLSQLIERALSGEEVIIAKAGKPVVRLVKLETQAKRVLGSAAGTIRYAPGWDEPLGDHEMEDFVAP